MTDYTEMCECGSRRLDAFKAKATRDDVATCRACGAPWPEKEYSAFSTGELKRLREDYRQTVANERLYMDPNPATRKGGRNADPFGDAFLVEAQERLEAIAEVLASRGHDDE